MPDPRDEFSAKEKELATVARAIQQRLGLIESSLNILSKGAAGLSVGASGRPWQWVAVTKAMVVGSLLPTS